MSVSGYFKQVDGNEELLDPGLNQELTVSSTSGVNEANSDRERDDDKERRTFLTTKKIRSRRKQTIE